MLQRAKAELWKREHRRFAPSARSSARRAFAKASVSDTPDQRGYIDVVAQEEPPHKRIHRRVSIAFSDVRVFEHSTSKVSAAKNTCYCFQLFYYELQKQPSVHCARCGGSGTGKNVQFSGYHGKRYLYPEYTASYTLLSYCSISYKLSPMLCKQR